MAKQTVDKTYERIDEKTPNGGEYSIAYFSDENGIPADKDKAVRAEIVEFDKSGKEIHRTHAILK